MRKGSSCSSESGGYWFKLNSQGVWQRQWFVSIALHASLGLGEYLSEIYSNISEMITRTKSKQLHASPCSRSAIFTPKHHIAACSQGGKCPSVFYALVWARCGYSSLIHMVFSPTEQHNKIGWCALRHRYLLRRTDDQTLFSGQLSLRCANANYLGYQGVITTTWISTHSAYHHYYHH